MRTTAAEKEKLREEILKDSIKTFKKSGLAGAPVDQIMKRAGLTSGALYSHFKGKDNLFYEAVLKDMDNLVARYSLLVTEKGTVGIKQLVDEYLSLRHVQNSDIGCMFCALGSDLSRASSHHKTSIEARHLLVAEAIAKGLKKGTLDERIKKVRLSLATMIGSVTLARSLSSEKEISSTLELAREHVYSLLSLA